MGVNWTTRRYTCRRGLPIGNLTSQWFANWCLTAFDHRATSVWRLGGYVRYCDDFLLLDDDRKRLLALLPELLSEFARLRLRLHAERLHLQPSSAGRTFVGFRTTPARRRLTNASVRGFLRRLTGLRKAFGRRLLGGADVRQRLMSWLGHATQGDCLGLIGRLATNWRFRAGEFHGFRDDLSHPACPSSVVPVTSGGRSLDNSAFCKCERSSPPTSTSAACDLGAVGRPSAREPFRFPRRLIAW